MGWEVEGDDDDEPWRFEGEAGKGIFEVMDI